MTAHYKVKIRFKKRVFIFGKSRRSVTIALSSILTSYFNQLGFDRSKYKATLKEIEEYEFKDVLI